MEVGRNTWAAAIRLAITLSLVATATTIVVRSLGDVSETAIVLSVIVIGFVTSWVRTGHVAAGETTSHRVARVPVHRTHPVG